MRSKILMLVALSMFATVKVAAQDLPAVGSYSDDARAARISELKVKYRIALSQDERTRIVERCDIAKQNLRKLSQGVADSTATRLATYDAAVETLSSLRALVAARQVDASSLELLIVDYQKARTEFDIASTAYITALDDSLVLDCIADPDGFRASIEGVREARIATSAVTKDIDELTASNLKTAFDTLKIRLSAEDSRDGK